MRSVVNERESAVGFLRADVERCMATIDELRDALVKERRIAQQRAVELDAALAQLAASTASAATIDARAQANDNELDALRQENEALRVQLQHERGERKTHYVLFLFFVFRFLFCFLLPLHGQCE